MQSELAQTLPSPGRKVGSHYAHTSPETALEKLDSSGLRLTRLGEVDRADPDLLGSGSRLGQGTTFTVVLPKNRSGP